VNNATRIVIRLCNLKALTGSQARI